MIDYHWRGTFDNAEINALHAEGFGHPVSESNWIGRLERHSLGWVCARQAGELIGFVNLVWDGGVHVFLVDTVVAKRVRHQRAAAALVSVAATRAAAAGCQWLHVDFEDHLAGFYFDACRFRPTQAGLLRLQEPSADPARSPSGDSPAEG